MTKEDQDNALIKVCGFIQHERWPDICISTRNEFKQFERRFGVPFITLDFMHEAEKVLTLENAYRYAETLAEVLNMDGVGIWDYSDVFKIINAAAAQRAEAFLKTLNLWK